MPRSYSVYPWRNKEIQLPFDCRRLLSSLQKSFKENENHWLRACDEGRQVLQWFMWKHHFSPLDTSSALAWLTISPYLVVPAKPVINQLPPEIITKILAHVVHSDSSEPKDRFCHQICRRISSGSSPTTPIILTHVCRSWRAMVQDTPTLWSTIMALCPVGTDVDYVSFLLSKTGNCPLTLGLQQYMTPDPASVAIAKLFVAQAHRWKRISFTLMRCVHGPFSDLRPNDVPLLEEYRVRIDSWDPEDIGPLFQALHSSPVLDNMDWGKSLSGQVPDDSPWCRLSELTLHSTELSQSHLSSLSHCKSLKILRMRRMRRPGTTPPGPIILDHVERIICDRPDSFALVFDSFTLPSLRDLEFTDRHPLKSCDVASLIEMLKRSRCILKTVSVDGHSMPVLAASASMFRTTVTLKILSDIVGKDLMLLMRRGDRANLFPDLQNLILHNCRTKDGVLAAVVWSRREELRTLQVCMDLTASPQDQMTLRWLKNDGLLVSTYEPVARFATFYFRGNPREPDCDVVPMIHIPDLETLW